MTRLLLLWLALAAAPVLAASPQDLLEPEKAFRFSARALDAEAVEVQFAIAEGYYLYRERFKFAAENARLGKPEYPAGGRKKDQFFGDSETYRKEVRIRVPVEPGAGDPLKLVVTSQGCADIGVCYVPMESMATLHLASLAAAMRRPRACRFRRATSTSPRCSAAAPGWCWRASSASACCSPSLPACCR